MMKNTFKTFSLAYQQRIKSAIYAGNKMAAIKLYKEADKCHLMSAKQAIDELTIELKAANPYAFKKSTPGYGDRLVLIICSLIVAAGAFFLLPDVVKQAVRGIETATLQTDAGKNDQEEESEAKPGDMIDAAAGKWPAAESFDPYQPISPNNGAWNLLDLYRFKLANSDYVEWKNRPGLPVGYQDFTEEHHIKYVRALLAEHLLPPAQQNVISIPVISAAEINIDGDIEAGEWQQATRIMLSPQTAETQLYLQADTEWLYLACDVPEDRTESGFDQLRFYFHIDIDPVIKNERIHVGRAKHRQLGGIRQTTVRWQGTPPANDNERWKKYAINDWRIYRLALGASSLRLHRQFEAKINLQESGLHIGVPFPAFVEVETDPVYENGHFKHRVSAGKLGEQDQPVWLVMH